MTDLLLPGPSHAVVIRLSVTLDDAVPPIHRELEVRGELTLDVLHEVLQVTMGWEDYHLHRFWRGPEPYHPEEPRFLTEIDLDDGEDGIPEASVRADQVLREPGDTLGYLYDFGDDWTHTLRVADVRPAIGGEPPARCLAGSRACPPEDVGGIGTYNDLVAALAAARPDAAQTALLDQYRPWLSEDFDPARFDADATTTALLEAEQHTAAVVDLLASPVVALQTLADRFGGGELRLLVDLWTQAGSAPLPATADLATALRPWQVLLEAVGPGGLALTGARWLPPVVVQELAHDLGLHHWWLGAVNRESHTAPIAALRRSAQALRLVRISQGRLVRSPAGRRVAGDPDALWQHLATTLPTDRGDFAQEAGAVWLLCLAAGRPDHDELAARILTVAGWRVDGGAVNASALRHGAAGLGDVLSVLHSAFRSADPADRDATRAQPVIRALAARAVRGQ